MGEVDFRHCLNGCCRALSQDSEIQPCKRINVSQSQHSRAGQGRHVAIRLAFQTRSTCCTLGFVQGWKLHRKRWGHLNVVTKTSSSNNTWKGNRQTCRWWNQTVGFYTTWIKFGEPPGNLRAINFPLMDILLDFYDSLKGKKSFSFFAFGGSRVAENELHDWPYYELLCTNSSATQAVWPWFVPAVCSHPI